MHVTSDAPDRFARGSVVYTGDARRALTVASVRKQGERTIVLFDEVADRNDAEALKGAELVVPQDAARSLGSDEYWDHDLVGCVVQTVSGDEIGRVTDVLHQPGGEILVVRGSGKEHLIPLARDIVREVAPRERITIDPLPGLLE